MNAPSSRKLVAILFTDIAGYTTMMQKDEASAMEVLNTYQSSVKRWVGEYGGEIIKNYGDGGIFLFPSTNGCIRCAYDLQKEIHSTVPLRIGLHLGDVLYKDGDVYGDDINIASRIESMGVAGNILMSESFFRRVKNKADLQFQSLGKYNFKNIEDPIEVFALKADILKVPGSHEITGKNKPIKTVRFNPVWGLAIIVALALILVLDPFGKIELGSLLKKGNSNTDQLSTLAVLDFENNTGNHELDMVGRMASDRIIHGITQNDLARVVTSEAIEQYDKMLLASVTPSDKFTMLRNQFDVTKVITGKYYLDGSDLLLECSIVDPNSNKIIKGLDPVKCNKDNPMEGIEQIRETILGYVAIDQDRDINLLLETHIPNFEAYQELLKAKDAADSEEMLVYCERSLTLDSLYFEPKLLRLSAFYNLEKFPLADSLRKQLRKSSMDFDKRQQNLLNFYDALLTGKNDLIYKYFKNEYDRSPFDLMSNNTQMVLAIEFINDPDLAAPMYNVIPNKDLNYANCGNCRTRLYIKILLDLKQDNPEEAIATALRLRKNGGGTLGRPLLIRAYVQSAQWAEIEDFIESEGLRTKGKDLLELYHAVSGEAILKGLEKEAQQYAELAKEHISEDSDPVLASKVLIILNELDRASSILQDHLRSDPESKTGNTLLAGIFLRQSDSLKAQSFIDVLENLRGPYQFGEIDYKLAQAYIIGGDKVKALNYLKASVVHGQRYTWNQYDLDYLFKPLLSDPKFEDILTYWQ